MGIWDIFKSKRTGPFVSVSQFRDNLDRQGELASETLSQLKNYGATDDSELKLEFFFYSQSLDKAEQLADSLKKLDYEVEVRESAGDNNLFPITGWTTKMKMYDETVESWTKQMCVLGYEFDCDFDGWGTTPDQE
jgi:regulator of RNase E activity RraB